MSMTLEDFQDRSEFGRYLTESGRTGTGVEVGVFRGEFSNHILRSWNGNLIGVDSYNNGTDFHLLWDSIRNKMDYVMDSRYKILVCQSHVAANYVQDDLGFVYIDADHSHAAVSQDIAMWYPKIRAGGLLCGHDYDLEGTGVKQAVDEFLSQNLNLKMFKKKCRSWFIEKL